MPKPKTMKGLLLLLTCTVFATDSFAQSNTCAPEELRASVMAVLTAPDSMKFNALQAIHFNESHVPQLVEKMRVSESAKKEILENTKQAAIDQACRDKIAELLRSSEVLEIRRDKLEYEEFLYEYGLHAGIKELRGSIYLKQDDRHFAIRLSAVDLNGELLLTELGHLQSSHYLHGYPDEMEDFFGDEAFEQAVEVGGEDIEVTAPPIQEEVFYSPEQQPAFPGGAEALHDWMKAHLTYPEAAREDNASGTVYIQFIVDENGAIRNMTVLRSPHEALSEEAKRLVGSMPNWIPAEQNGRRVRVRYTLPVKFEVE